MKEGMPVYPILEAEIAKHGLKKKDIARALNIQPRSLSDKLSGKTDFWWKEIKIISDMFPNIPVTQLFGRRKENVANERGGDENGKKRI